jgi:cytidine deaminase
MSFVQSKDHEVVEGMLASFAAVGNSLVVLPQPEPALSQDLFEAAKAAMAFSHSPYSKFPVGAAIRADDGNIYSGANIENVAFPQGWCAEATAIGQMIMGGGRRITEVAVIAEKLALCPPCGGCRQKLSEFADAGVRVWLCDATGPQKSLTVAELLPAAFDTDALG